MREIPNTQECFYILEMLETSLIDYSYTQPWADALIIETQKPPVWLCELATNKYRGDQIQAIREHLFSEPFEEAPASLEKFRVACLWLRYERRELSWAIFLKTAGEYLDATNGDWDCSTPYHYLNVFEDAYFTPEAEAATKKDYLNDHPLQPWLELARLKFAPFLKHRISCKSSES